MKLKDSTIAIPNEFMCPINYEIMEEPVIAADGHSYQRSAIETWLHNHNTSPATNEILAHKQLVTNWNLKKAIAEFIEKANHDYDRRIAEKEEHQFRNALAESRQQFVREQLAVENLQTRQALERSRKEVAMARQEASALRDSLAQLQVSSGDSSEVVALEARLAMVSKQLSERPFCEKLLNTKAKLLKDLGRLDEALRLLNQAIAHYPNNEYLLTARGSVFKRMGNVDSAQQDFDRAQEVKKEGIAQLGIATAASRQHSAAAAVPKHSASILDDSFAVRRRPAAVAGPRRHIDHSVGVSSDDTFETAKALAESAKVLKGEKKFVEALGLSKQSLELAPNNPYILNGYADTLCKMGHYQKAVRVFDEVLTLNPHDIFALNGKGLAHQNIGETKQAIQAYKQVLTIQSSNKLALAGVQQLQGSVNAPAAVGTHGFFARRIPAASDSAAPASRSQFNYH